MARTLLAHSGHVTAVNWTQSSCQLLSSSADGSLIVREVLQSTPLLTVQMGSEVLHSALHLQQHTLRIACMGPVASGQAYISCRSI